MRCPTDWVPAEYLAGYYRTVEVDEVATIAYIVQTMRHAERDEPVLFFGVGPTLHHVFAAAEIASEIHLGDYLPGNLTEIQRWIDYEPGAHDWRPFVRYTLQCEGISCPTDEEIAAREDLTRTKITDLVRVDARHPSPIDRRYPTVISPYCADSGYTVAGKTFPGADIDEHDLRTVLQPEFEPHDGSVEIRQPRRMPATATRRSCSAMRASASNPTKATPSSLSARPPRRTPASTAR